MSRFLWFTVYSYGLMAVLQMNLTYPVATLALFLQKTKFGDSCHGCFCRLDAFDGTQPVV